MPRAWYEMQARSYKAFRQSNTGRKCLFVCLFGWLVGCCCCFFCCCVFFGGGVFFLFFFFFCFCFLLLFLYAQVRVRPRASLSVYVCVSLYDPRMHVSFLHCYLHRKLQLAFSTPDLVYDAVVFFLFSIGFLLWLDVELGCLISWLLLFTGIDACLLWRFKSLGQTFT